MLHKLERRNIRTDLSVIKVMANQMKMDITFIHHSIRVLMESKIRRFLSQIWV